MQTGRLVQMLTMEQLMNVLLRQNRRNYGKMAVCNDH